MEFAVGLLTPQNRKLLIWMLVFLLLVAGCQSNQGDDELKGPVTLWHSGSASEAAVLDEAIIQFQEIHPEVKVITVGWPRDEILNKFQRSGRDGVGPDLLIGNDSWIGDLADEGLIRPVDDYISTEALTEPTNRSLTMYQDQVFGVPLFLEPRALYFNKQQVNAAPDDLDDLLREAAQGNRVAFVPRFEEAYWGIQAFGNGLFDSEGRFTLASSGFEEWLGWLNHAKREPGVILNVDDQSLLALFVDGEITYYVAGPDRQKLMPDFLDEDTPFEFGVAPLPGGPSGASGPLLSADTIMLYAFSSEQQHRNASALATFLANRQQGIRFLRDLNRVPANPSINVDPRIYPVPNGFSRQARTAVVLPNEIPNSPLIAAGDRAYTSLLSGLLTPREAVCQFGREVVDIMNYGAEDVDLPQGCSFAVD